MNKSRSKTPTKEYQIGNIGLNIIKAKVWLKYKKTV